MITPYYTKHSIRDWIVGSIFLIMINPYWLRISNSTVKVSRLQSEIRLQENFQSATNGNMYSSLFSSKHCINTVIHPTSHPKTHQKEIINRTIKKNRRNQSIINVKVLITTYDLESTITIPQSWMSSICPQCAARMNKSSPYSSSKNSWNTTLTHVNKILKILLLFVS